MHNHEDKVTEVNNLAEQLVSDGHPEENTIRTRQEVSITLHTTNYLILRKIPLEQDRRSVLHYIQQILPHSEENTIKTRQEVSITLHTTNITSF